MALSIFVSSILISGCGGYEVLDLRGSICEYVLQSIPILADHVFWDNLLLFNHTDTDRPQKIKQWLSSQCMHRYEELVFDHEFNYEQVLFGEIEMRRGPIQKVNKNLLVLDLDQTIIYQKQTLDAYHSTVNIQEYNTNDLQFSRYFADPGPANLIIYRPFLMHMFMHNVMSSDFMIYAATCRDKVIFNILGLLHCIYHIDQYENACLISDGVLLQLCLEIETISKFKFNNKSTSIPNDDNKNADSNAEKH